MMRIRLVQLGLASVLIAAGLVAPIRALAQTPPAEEVLVDISLKDADMVAATRMLAKQTGLQFMIEASEVEFKRITLELTQLSAKEVLKMICQSAGASYRRDPNGVYIIRAGSKGTIDIAPPLAEPAVKKARIAKKIKVLKGNAYDIYNQIIFAQAPDKLQGYRDLQDFTHVTEPQMTKFHNREPILNISDKPNQFKPLDISQIHTQYNGESGSAIILPGEAAPAQGGVDTGGGGGRGGGGGGFGGGQGGGIGGGQGGGIGQTQLQAGRGLVGESITFISYDPTDNSIVVQGTEEDIADLQRYISMFDVAPKQVTVKVEFVTTSSSLSKSLGFEWLYERGTLITGVRPGSFARSGDPIFMSYQTGNVSLRMRALLSSGQGKVVQAPIIRTLNNQPASVFSQVQTSIFISQVVSVGNGQVITVPQLVSFTITTGLAVAPRINDDGTITMFINVPVQDFGQLRTGPNGEQVPDLLSEQINVVARVKNGETIALGGLTRKSDEGTLQKFPILADLPIIGQFFRSMTRERNNTELLIFVTPTIIEEDQGGIGG